MLKTIAHRCILKKLPPVLHFQPLSTVPETISSDRLESFRTSESDPLKHTSNNAAQFYALSDDVKQQLFTYGGLPKKFVEQSKTFNETCLMIRQPSLDVINCLRKINHSKPMVKFVLYGKKGVGKSLSLAHILHYGFNAGYLLMHVPWVGLWMRSFKERSNSLTKEGYIDLNLDAAHWLLHFKTQNGRFFGDPNLCVGEDVVWSKREVTPKGAPLLELIEHGINRVKYASDCVVVLAKEVKRLAKDNKIKVLVAIDGFNAFFYSNTRIKTDKKEIVHPKKVVLTEAFMELTKFDWNNSVAVLTVDEIAIAEEDQLSHLPRYESYKLKNLFIQSVLLRNTIVNHILFYTKHASRYLLGKDGFEHLDPFIPILVPSYSEKELVSCLNYFRERRWIQPYKGQDEELFTLTAGNPYKLMELCYSL